jgi:sodium transport system permease protein
MKAGNVWIVFRKEFLDVLRDRRTLFSMILLPILIFPLMTVGLGGLVAGQIEKMEERSSPVVVLNGEKAPGLVAALQENSGLQVITTIADSGAAVTMLKEQAVQAIIWINVTQSRAVVGAEFDAGFSELAIWYDGAQHESEIVMRKVKNTVTDYREDCIRLDLEQRGLSGQILEPFTIASINRASESQMAGVFLGMMLPYMVILLAMVGSTYIAIDLTAGEKERGTMETLLVSPASRLELVLGKFFTTMLGGTITAILSVVSMSATFYAPGSLLQSEIGGGGGFALDPFAYGMVFLLLIPLAALFAAVLMAIAVNARSYKEAQSYVYPVIIAVIFPAIASMLPGFEATSRMALIPVLNVSLILREAFTGIYNWDAIVITFVSSIVYAAFAIFITMRVFQKESVLLRI